MRVSLLGALLTLGCSPSLDLSPPGDGAAPDGAADLGAADQALPDGGADGAPDAAPRDAAPACLDPDGDGHGEGCVAGPDCDEAEPRAWTGAEERCDGVDNDCDGATDETWPALGDGCEAGLGACAGGGVFACAPSEAGVFCDAEVGAGGDETCNGRDDDCDVAVDEDVADCCEPGQTRRCGIPAGACTLGDQVCGPNRVWGACSGQGPRIEACDGADNDCDGRTDEGVLNRCGVCGAEPAEVCNGRDDDCDGALDEGVSNACGGCGDLPAEVCNGADDDCDGATDEGVANACGACGPAPAEVCNGADDDCDGVADEAGCRGYYLAPGADAWTTPPGLNRGPAAGAAEIRAAAATADDRPKLWVFGDNQYWQYVVDSDLWSPTFALSSFNADLPNSIWGAYAVPVWWRRALGQDVDSTLFYVGHGGQATVIELPPGTFTGRTVEVLDLEALWAAQPGSPAPRAGRASIWDPRNTRGLWPGSPVLACGAEAPALTTTLTILTADDAYLYDDAVCDQWLAPRRVSTLPALALPNAPPAGRITAWVHLEREAVGQGAEYVFISPWPAAGE